MEPVRDRPPGRSIGLRDGTGTLLFERRTHLDRVAVWRGRRADPCGEVPDNTRTYVVSATPVEPLHSRGGR
jgi:hypothetical protein